MRSARRTVSRGLAIGAAPGLILFGLAAAFRVAACGPDEGGGGCKYDTLIVSLAGVAIASTGGLAGALAGICLALRSEQAPVARSAYYLVGLGLMVGVIPGLALASAVMGLSSCEAYQAGLFGRIECGYDPQVLWLVAIAAISTGGVSGALVGSWLALKRSRTRQA